jgi:hypothetical protein
LDRVQGDALFFLGVLRGGGGCRRPRPQREAEEQGRHQNCSDKAHGFVCCFRLTNSLHGSIPQKEVETMAECEIFHKRFFSVRRLIGSGLYQTPEKTPELVS